jgi:hypothetical protein
MLLISDPTVTIDGVTYKAVLSKVTRTHLGKEDHGIPTFVLDTREVHGGGARGIGMYDLRHSTGVEILLKFLDFFGTSWENLIGKQFFLLYEQSAYGPVAGLVSEDGKKHLLFKAVD